jgi:hypothetical protein
MKKLAIILAVLITGTAFAQSKAPELTEKAKVELLSVWRDYKTQEGRVKDAEIAVLQAQAKLEKERRGLDDRGSAVNAVVARYNVPGYQINIDKLTFEEGKK